MAKSEDRGFFGEIAHAIRHHLGSGEEGNPAERSAAPSRRTQKLPTDPAERFQSAHWGVPPNRRWHEPDVAGELVEMGKLLELHVDGEVCVEYPKTRQGDRPPILAFTTDTAERLYISLPDELKRENARNLIEPGAPWVSLDAAAKQAGGRQTRWGYPAVQVQVIGPCTHVVYATHKEGDGPSEYQHEFAEEKTPQSRKPLLCVDRVGRLWLAGGSYRVSDDGIED